MLRMSFKFLQRLYVQDRRYALAFPLSSLYVWIARVHCTFLEFFIQAATSGHLLYHSQHDLLNSVVAKPRFIVIARVIRLLIELVYHHYDFATYICQWGGLCSSWPLLELFILPTYWSIKFPYLSRAFASLTFIVVIRCASQELYYLLGGYYFFSVLSPLTISSPRLLV